MKTHRERKSSTLTDQGSAAVELAHKHSSSLHHTRAADPSAGKSASMGRGGRKGTLPSEERLEAGRAALLTCLCWVAGGWQEEG